MDEQQKEAFKAAVDRKKQQAEAASHQDGPPPESHSGVTGNQRRDEQDARAKNSGHGQKTADKWNQ
jgi:hypothetical protein